MKGLAIDFGMAQEPGNMFCDSQGAILLIKNQMSHDCTKHLEVRVNFILDCLDSGEVDLQKISTADNPADMPAYGKVQAMLGLGGHRLVALK